MRSKRGRAVLILAALLWVLPAALEGQQACVDINRAPAEQLRRIIHVDQARSAEIIRLRQARPFRSVDELTRVSGIGAARVRDIKAQGLACVTSGSLEWIVRDRGSVHERMKLFGGASDAGAARAARGNANRDS